MAELVRHEDTIQRNPAPPPAAPPTEADYQRYPLLMAHPHFTPASVGQPVYLMRDDGTPVVDRSGKAVLSHHVNGTPEKFSPVTVHTRGQEDYYAARGYEPAGRQDPAAWVKANAHPVSVHDYIPIKYPMMVGDRTVNSEEEEAEARAALAAAQAAPAPSQHTAYVSEAAPLPAYLRQPEPLTMDDSASPYARTVEADPRDAQIAALAEQNAMMMRQMQEMQANMAQIAAAVTAPAPAPKAAKGDNSRALKAAATRKANAAAKAAAAEGGEQSAA